MQNIGPWGGRSLLDTPYSITVYSKDQIQNRSISEPGDLARIDPRLSTFVPSNRTVLVSNVISRGFTILQNNLLTDGLEAVLGDTGDRPLADHATATVRVYRLETTAGDPGDSPLEFHLISTTTTTKRYCNAELALSQVLSVPLLAAFGGFNKTDGCFAS